MLNRSSLFSIVAILVSGSGAACSGAGGMPEVGSTEPGRDNSETIGQASQALVRGTYAYAWAWVDRNDGRLTAGYDANVRVDATDTWPFRRYSAPGDSTVTHLATGYWQVTFPNIAVSGGTVHVTAYGGNHHCNVGGWESSGADIHVYAHCFDGDTPVDGKFSVLFYCDDPIKSPVDADAYVWADSPLAASYTPLPDYQFNSRGAINTITRSSTGEYQVRLPHMERDPSEIDKGGTVQVTAYGPGSQRCKVHNWYPSGNDILVNVGCLRGAAPADSLFTLSWMRNPGAFAKFVAEDTQERFYVWANTTPVPSPFYQSDSYGNAGATMEFFPPNGYRVHLPGVESSSSTNAQVSAYGYGDAHCTIGRWFSDGPTGTAVDVQCYDAGGAGRASMFTLLYSTDRTILF
jgi:hypothetical protein